MSPIVNLQLVVKCKKRSFHSFKVEVALLRYIVFYCELGCDTSEPHVSYISRACSSLVRQPYYIPNRFILQSAAPANFKNFLSDWMLWVTNFPSRNNA